MFLISFSLLALTCIGGIAGTGTSMGGNVTLKQKKISHFKKDLIMQLLKLIFSRYDIIIIIFKQNRWSSKVFKTLFFNQYSLTTQYTVYSAEVIEVACIKYKPR